ncbi:MAG: uroporphyrinogen decarboxylase [Candidatus Eisenbacteria bacterium]|nr:uroporphyrinogen decarboxylase [Candidatus Eisenbacteria bacterium]
MNDRFLKACRQQPVDATPVWIMRQAGRYLPQYMAIRRGTDFLTFCKSPKLLAQAAFDAVDVLGVDAAILFSDILLPLEAMGLPLVFEELHGPRLPEPIRGPADLSRLIVPDPARTMPFVGEAIERTLERLNGAVPLIGFAGAPFTLAAYAIEGGGSKNYSHTLGWLHRDPESFGKLLDLMTLTVIRHLEFQIKTGVHAVQLFDSWGGWVSADLYQREMVPRLQRIVAAIKPMGVPVILYVNGSTHLLEAMNDTGADVLSVDWRLPLDEVRRRVGPRPALQGNLDPCSLYAPPEIIAAEVRTILAEAGPTGHILNLGHGILPDAPVSGAVAMVNAAHASSPLDTPHAVRSVEAVD